LFLAIAEEVEATVFVEQKREATADGTWYVRHTDDYYL